nr:MAG TPA: putative tail component [Caudoviricetes sp.]
MKEVTPDNLAAALMKELEQYSNDVTEGIKESVDRVAKEANEEIKRHITFKQPTKAYVKSFRIKKTYDSHYRRERTWHADKSQARLTHLLENGHALHQGGRTDAFPHIIYGEKLAQQRMEELAKEAIKNAGR